MGCACNEPKGAWQRVWLPLLEKVLVPILAAGIAAYGAYVAAVSQAGKDAKEAAVEEVRQAEEARAFVLEHLPTVAPELAEHARWSPVMAAAPPAPIDSRAILSRLEDLWFKKALVAGIDSETVAQQIPLDHMRRAFREQAIRSKAPGD